MANRITNGLEEITRWKQLFENLIQRGVFSRDTLQSRAFRKEELRQYNRLLSRNRSGLSQDERIEKRFVNQQRRQLERELYPNPLIRLLRNLSVLSKAVILLPANAIANRNRQSRELSSVSSGLDKLGLSELRADVAKKLKTGQKTFSEALIESPSAKEMLDYRLSFQRNGNGLSEIGGLSATLSFLDSKEKRILGAKDTVGLTREQVGELLHGRAINSHGSRWKVPDINDKDASGNIKIRDVLIPDFNPEAALKKLPLAIMPDGQLHKLSTDIKNGKRVTVPLRIGGRNKTVELEANPIRRGFDFYLDNTRTTLLDLTGRKKQSERLEISQDLKQKKGKVARLQ